MAAESLVQAKIIKHLQNRHAYVVKVITASKAGGAIAFSAVGVEFLS